MPLLRTLPRPVIKERMLYITPDGTTYELDVRNNRAVVYDTGSGLPDIEYVTQRGPFQHGETIKDYFLRPRMLELRYRRNFCSREEYWAGRAELLNILRPGRAGFGSVNQGILRKILPNGEMRDIAVTIQQGPKFEAQRTNEWDEWSIDEVLRFVAYNPVYFDPASNSQTFGQGGALTFPITFPIVFANFGSTVTLDYEGSWIEYPIITITGPLDVASILNETTDENIGLTYSIPAGRTVTIDLSYGIKTVTLDDGTNLLGYITSDSDIATFHLEPGNNTVRVFGVGAIAATQLVIAWHNRYIGI